jgi:hypothetical protein
MCLAAAPGNENTIGNKGSAIRRKISEKSWPVPDRTGYAAQFVNQGQSSWQETCKKGLYSMETGAAYRTACILPDGSCGQDPKFSAFWLMGRVARLRGGLGRAGFSDMPRQEKEEDKDGRTEKRLLRGPGSRKKRR